MNKEHVKFWPIAVAIMVSVVWIVCGIVTIVTQNIGAMVIGALASFFILGAGVFAYLWGKD